MCLSEIAVLNTKRLGVVTGRVVLLVAGRRNPDLYVGSAEFGQLDAGTSVHFLGGAMTVSLYCLHLLITELSQVGLGLYPSTTPASPLSLLTSGHAVVL